MALLTKRVLRCSPWQFSGFSVATVFWFSEHRSPEEEARSYYEHGVKLAEQHDYAKAAIELRNALRLKNEYAAGVAQPCADRRSHSTLGRPDPKSAIDREP